MAARAGIVRALLPDAGISRRKRMVVHPSLEFTDPTPDVNQLFTELDSLFFSGLLSGLVDILWNEMMVTCLGLFIGLGGRPHGNVPVSQIQLSEPLLQMRPRKDLVETLLHEMIHAYIYLYSREDEEHGPQFCFHMDRINRESGAEIKVAHPCFEEVAYCSHLKKMKILHGPDRKKWPALWQDGLRDCSTSHSGTVPQLPMGTNAPEVMPMYPPNPSCWPRRWTSFDPWMHRSQSQPVPAGPVSTSSGDGRMMNWGHQFWHPGDALPNSGAPSWEMHRQPPFSTQHGRGAQLGVDARANVDRTNVNFPFDAPGAVGPEGGIHGQLYWRYTPY